MNIFDVLYARNTGRMNPRAKITDNLLGLALAGGGYEEKTVDWTPVISVSDAKAGNALDYQIKITAKQTGTPSPQNICPIDGWTGAQITRAGKNLLSPSYFKQALIDSCDNRIVVNGDLVTLPNGGGNVKSSGSDRTKIFEGKFAENTVYTIIIGAADTPKQYSLFTVFYKDGTSQPMTSGVYDSDNKCWRYATTTGKSVNFIRMNRDQALSTTYDTSKSGIFVGNVSADSFVAYTDLTVYPVSWQTEAGTVYGGTLDATTGALSSVYVPQTYDGTENWHANSLGNGYYLPLGNSNDYDFEKPLICSCLYGMNAGSSSGLPINGIRMNGNPVSLNLLVKVDTTNDFPSVDDWKAFLAQNPMTVLFPLATPIEYTLTPTEITLAEGSNTIWSDTGDSKLTYLAKK